MTMAKKSKKKEKQQEKLIWDSIRVEISRHNILFIGYSISDQNIQMLLDDVKRHMGDSVKQLFVLTPNIDETARLRLHKLGAIHIQGTAKDLFKELIPAIKDHIVEDFEKRATTSEDCALFLKEYDLCPQVELGGVHTPNKLLSVRSISGKAVRHTINFSLKGNGIENPLEQIQPYYDENFGYLPTRRITDFNNFEYDEFISRMYYEDFVYECRYYECKGVDILLYCRRVSKRRRYKNITCRLESVKNAFCNNLSLINLHEKLKLLRKNHRFLKKSRRLRFLSFSAF